MWLLANCKISLKWLNSWRPDPVPAMKIRVIFVLVFVIASSLRPSLNLKVQQSHVKRKNSFNLYFDEIFLGHLRCFNKHRIQKNGRNLLVSNRNNDDNILQWTKCLVLNRICYNRARKLRVSVRKGGHPYIAGIRDTSWKAHLTLICWQYWKLK